ncbi:inositol polyphosphate multikinase beta isoform X2 [Neltuma alba]|uniref:inositol polyphosphate multikinase beta isoform X2 n=1 Tax=Neltuma alba TaxID=207710 RepID=UPI0010A4F2C5|nr:inositol polyphosphate multikinase beta-like isoform X2 [Prosopis alba]
MVSFCWCSCQFVGTMLKVPAHQVAGHLAEEGHLGPLVDDCGCFYKPLQSGNRGSQEVEFYESLYSDARIPDHIRRYFPVFYGTKKVYASDGSGLHPHLVLQNLVSSYENPSIIDIKIGSRTWYPQASEDYIRKSVEKDQTSSSLLLGFRISGLKAFVSKDSGFWKPKRKLLQTLAAEDVKLVLKKFVSSNAPENHDVQPDCFFASEVYGGSSGILAQLLELKAWFEVQTIFHFYASSALIVFDKESVLKGKSSGAAVKLVDFAHVVEGAGVIDHNFLGGLCSLIKFIADIVAPPIEKCLSNGNDTKSEKCSDGSLSTAKSEPLSLDPRED